MRLNAFISRAGISSRRKAVELITGGKVKVSGRITCEPWYVVKDGDEVVVDGKRISEESHAYFVVNKPAGVTSTADDPNAAKKVTDIVPKKFGRLYPVGRLDADSRGLILLTNDGDLCYRLTHPKFEIEKEYVVTVKGAMDEKALKAAKKGVYNEGDILKVKSCSNVELRGKSTTLHVTIAEGKKRHLRRLFAGLGFPVKDLKRVRIGSIRLDDLREGMFRKIDKERAYACLNRRVS